MRHVYECPMRWADLDMLGHVNNVVYVDYLQEARVDMLRSHARRESGELTEGVVVVRHEVTYQSPLTFRFRPVKIAALGDETATLAGGLRTGERFAALGSHLLREGQTVRVQAGATR